MNYGPYLEFEKESLILRDYLAADRTALAIDRTVLSYIRTALTALIAGVSFIKFFNNQILTIIGWLLVILTPIILLFGLWRIWEMKKLVTSVQNSDEKIMKKETEIKISPAPTSNST